MHAVPPLRVIILCYWEYPETPMVYGHAQFMCTLTDMN